MSFSFQIEERTILKRINWDMIMIILALNIIGLFNLFSATHGPHSQDIQQLFINQLIWLAAGWSIFFMVTFVDYLVVSRIAYTVYFLNLLAVIYVSVFGTIALGAQRWIDFGFMRYQPSETMKLAMIMVLAKTLSGKSAFGVGLGIKDLAWPVFLLAVPFVLIVKQPDLGTAMTLAAIAGSLIIFMRIRRKILTVTFICCAIALPFVWNYVLHDYQKARITNFISPNKDPRGSGYNSIQSKIAVGSGKLVGKGFRQGTQSQLEFLPERHTDFIFSVLSEEFGFIGSLLVLALYCFLFLIIIRIASTSRDKFGALLTVGVLSYVFWHMFVNMGMVIGLLPIVGVPLPLLSYGGSSMLTTMASLGLISSVAYRRYLF